MLIWLRRAKDSRFFTSARTLSVNPRNPRLNHCGRQPSDKSDYSVVSQKECGCHPLNRRQKRKSADAHQKVQINQLFVFLFVFSCGKIAEIAAKDVSLQFVNNCNN